MSQESSTPPTPDSQEPEPATLASESAPASPPSTPLPDERLEQLPTWLQKEIIEGSRAASQSAPSGATLARQSAAEPARSALAGTQNSSPSFSFKEFLQKSFRLMIPFLLGGLIIMFFGLLKLFPSLPSFFSYAQGECIIKGSTLHSTSSLVNKKRILRYRPVFTFILHTTDQHVYEATGYEAQPEYTSYEEAKAIIYSYMDDRTHICWYDPASPTHAVLKRNLDFMGSSLFLLGLAWDGLCVFLWVKFLLLPELQSR